MANVIVPVVQPLMLCEEIDEEGGALNVYGLFNAMHASAYPYTRDSFCVFLTVPDYGEAICSPRREGSILGVFDPLFRDDGLPRPSASQRKS